MKRILSLALVLVLLAAVCLTGCTKTPASSAAPASSAQPASSAAESKIEPLKQATIQVWMLGPGKQTNSQKVWAKVNELLAKNVPNTTVEFTIIPFAEYKTKFNNMLASEEAVDLAWVGYATDLNQDLLDNNLMELDDLLDKYGANIKANLEQELIDVNRYNGKIHYIINWQSVISRRNAILLPTEFVTLAGGETWLKKANDVFHTAYKNPTVDNVQAAYDELAHYAQALKENNKLYGGFNMLTFNYNAEMFSNFGVMSIGVENVGVAYGDDTFTVKSMIGTDLHKLRAKNMKDFYDKGYIASDIASKKFVGWDTLKDGSYNNNTYIATQTNVHENDKDGAASASARFYRDISLLRTTDAGKNTKGTATAMAIPYCADQPERAMMFLNEVWGNKELYQTLIYGIAGEDYEPLEDGTIKTGYGSQGTADSPYGLWKWTIGTCMNSLVTEGDTKGFYEEMLELEKSAYMSPMENFIFDKTNVDGIISALSAINAKYSGVGSGYSENWEKDIEAWAAERKAAGEDELIAEYQKQVNEFIKANNITSWNYKNQ